MIDVFENAGYRTYAEIVRNIAACNVEGDHEMDNFGDYHEPFPQPETYPNPKPNPLSLTRENISVTSFDEFLQVNPAVAQDLPKSNKKVTNCNPYCIDSNIMVFL